MDQGSPASDAVNGSDGGRRGVVVIALVAAVVAIVGGVAWSRGGSASDQATYHDQAAKPVANAVWSVGDGLYDGSVRSEVTAAVATNLAPTLHGVAYGARNGDVVYQPTGGAAVTIGHHAQTGPAGDPTSGLVAWFETTGPRETLVTYNVTTSAVVDRSNLDVAQPGFSDAQFASRELTPILWVGRNNHGGVTVFFVADSSTWRYETRPGTPPNLTKVGEDILFDPALDVVAKADPTVTHFVDNDGRELSRYGPIEPDGQLSHDGKHYLGFGNGHILVVDTATGKADQLPLHITELPFGATWSRGNVVMFFAVDLTTPDGAGAVVACTIAPLECNTVDHANGYLQTALPSS